MWLKLGSFLFLALGVPAVGLTLFPLGWMVFLLVTGFRSSRRSRGAEDKPGLRRSAESVYLVDNLSWRSNINPIERHQPRRLTGLRVHYGRTFICPVRVGEVNGKHNRPLLTDREEKRT